MPPPSASLVAAPALTVTDADEFALDLRVVESAATSGLMLAESDDGCGSTCEAAACVTESSDPA